MKIGVLDDNQAILDYIATVLTLDNHTVETHATGESLLDALFSPNRAHDERPYDLIILDLLLPGEHSGADVFISIRKRFPAQYLPIIVVTAVGGATLEQFRLILPDDVPLLHKPFSPRSLRQMITRLTGGRDL